MPILIDSSVWIDFFNGRPTAGAAFLDRSMGREPLLVGDLILAEVLQGFRRDRDFRVAREALSHFPCVQISNHEIALKSASNYRRLRRLGFTVRNTIDSLIATYCIERGHLLLSPDRDYSPFSNHLGLATVDPDTGLATGG